jgi:hypothetical protein
MIKKTELANRRIHLSCLGLYPEVSVWSKKWTNLKGDSKRKGRKCLLSFEEYTLLASQAGLFSPDQIGVLPGKYQLGRVEDRGDYVLGNCRFIPKEQNLKERWMYAKR